MNGVKIALVGALAFFIPSPVCVAFGWHIELSGYTERPSAVGLRITSRPEEVKNRSGSDLCNFFWLGDDRMSPPPIPPLRQDLEDALGNQLANSTITVSTYEVFIVDHPLPTGYSPLIPPTVPGAIASAIFSPFIKQCPNDVPADAVYDPSELDAPGEPMIALIEANYEGKTYKARGIVRWTSLQDGYSAMHKANAALAEQIRQQSAAPSAAH